MIMMIMIMMTMIMMMMARMELAALLRMMPHIGHHAQPQDALHLHPQEDLEMSVRQDTREPDYTTLTYILNTSVAIPNIATE